MRLRSHQGWDAVELESDQVALTVIPGKGADIVSLVDRSSEIELMWHPRWGLRPPGAIALPGSSEALAMATYGGGWNTLFPNAGKSCVEHGVEWGFHGETWVAPFEWEPMANGILARTSLVRSPFVVEKAISLEGASVTVVERVTNVGALDVDVLWCQHPAFGAPLIGPATVIEADGCLVHPDVADPALAGIEATEWPDLPGIGTDLSRLDPPRSGTKRRAFLGEFGTSAHVRILNREAGVAVALEWSPSDFPYAWYWFEAGGRTEFPWYGAEYVLAIEPATGYPSGITDARRLTGTVCTIPAGETLTKAVVVTVLDSF